MTLSSQKAMKNYEPYATKPARLTKTLVRGSEAPYTASIELVTPQTAEAWLERNTRNRPMNTRNIRVMATDMRDGRWHPSNDAICFDKQDVLLNGQNRLAAVVASGTSQWFTVHRGFESDWFADMDRNKPRSLADDAHTYGFSHRTVVGAVALKLAGSIKAGELTSYTVRGLSPTAGNRGAASRRERQAVTKRWGHDIVNAIRATERYRASGLLSHSYIAFLHMMYASEWPEVVGFFSRAFTGVGIVSATDPAHAYRSMLLANAVKQKHEGKLPDHTLAGYGIIAANFDMGGLQRKRLQWRTDANRDFPQPNTQALGAYSEPFDWATRRE